MIIDCDSCAVRGPACSDCVVTFVLGPPDWLVGDGLAGEEAAALAVLADSGLVPPLRLVPRGPDADGSGAAPGAPAAAPRAV